MRSDGAQATSHRAALVALLWLASLTATAARADEHVESALERVVRGDPWPRRALMLDARRAAAVDVAWPSTPSLGAGATVCVVDTGLDLAHPAFRDETGASRVRWLLDVSGAPRDEHPDAPGALYDAADIDAALGGELPEWARDWHGHGTAITGAAAGDDGGVSITEPGAYAGVAPRAEIIVVRALRRGMLGFLDEDVVAGARFCAAAVPADRLVILLALGGHDGAHDGTEPLEAALAALARDGIAVVVAAGNEGDASIHAGGTVSPGRRTELELNVPAPGARAARVLVALRTAGAVGVVGPSTTLSPVARGAEGRSGHARIDGRSSRATYLLLEGDASAPLPGGTYRISVEGDFDAWITDHDLGDGFDRPAFVGRWAREGETVAVPATHPALIAVGASVSRIAWASEIDGPGLSIEPEPETGRAPFSALGPAASGAPRPDLLAPGALVRTTLSGTLEPGPDALFGDEAELRRFRRGDGVVLAGTSVSAAIVAGAVALARAEVPLADAEAERAALLLGASEGRLDVARYLEVRGAAVCGRADATRSRLVPSRPAVRPGLDALWATLVVVDGSARPCEGEVTVRAGERELGHGRLHRGLLRLPLASLEGDVGTGVRLEALLDGEMVASTSVLLSPDERGHPVSASGGGGCNAVAHRGSAVVLGLWLLALARTLRGEQTQGRARRRAGSGL